MEFNAQTEWSQTDANNSAGLAHKYWTEVKEEHFWDTSN